MTAQEIKEQKERIMQILDVTSEQADEIMECDRKIDRGERVYFDLSIEEEKQAIKQWGKLLDRKMPKKVVRQRKPNPTKQAVISELAQFLENICESGCKNVIITKKEGEINFAVGDETFTLKLTQHRKKKVEG